MTHVPLKQKIDEIGWPELRRQVCLHILDLVAEQPDKHYRPKSNFPESKNPPGNCYYSKDYQGNPGDGCIFGQAFYRAGVDVSEFDKYQTGKTIVFVLYDLVKLEFNDLPNSWHIIQSHQDQGYTWSESCEGLLDRLHSVGHNSVTA